MRNSSKTAYPSNGHCGAEEGLGLGVRHAVVISADSDTSLHVLKQRKAKLLNGFVAILKKEVRAAI